MIAHRAATDHNVMTMLYTVGSTTLYLYQVYPAAGLHCSRLMPNSFQSTSTLSLTSSRGEYHMSAMNVPPDYYIWSHSLPDQGNQDDDLLIEIFTTGFLYPVRNCTDEHSNVTKMEW